MKLQAPEGTTDISLAGEKVEISKDGICEVTEAQGIKLCEEFGFTVAGKTRAPEVAPVLDKFTDMSRAELIGYIKGKNLPVVPSTSNDQLRATARSQYSPEERSADEAALKTAADAAAAAAAK